VNRIRVKRIFNDDMQTLWPHGVRIDNMQLLVTGAPPYKEKAAEGHNDVA
jgi:hypothetical protein